MAVKIQIRRGTKAGLPTLAPGEYGLATDTGELFVGGESGNLQVAVLGSDGKVPESQLPEQTNLIDHMNNKQNPHAVTAEQVKAIPASEKGAAGGVATLGANGKVSPEQVDSFGKEDTLSASTAKLFGLPAKATPDDVFKLLHTQIGDTLTTARKDLGSSWLLCNGDFVRKEQYPELYSVLNESQGGSGFNTAKIASDIDLGYDNETIVDVAYGNGYYVVANRLRKDINFYLLWSKDLVVWDNKEYTYSDDTVEGNYAARVRFINGTFVVCGQIHGKPTILYTTDPSTGWQVTTLSSTINYFAADVAYKDGLWGVLISNGSASAVTFSTELSNSKWDEQLLTNRSSDTVNSIFCSNEAWVVCGQQTSSSHASIWVNLNVSDPQAANWTVKRLPGTDYYSSCTAGLFADGHYVLCGRADTSSTSYAVVWYGTSIDTLVKKQISNDPYVFCDVAYSNGTLALCTSNSTYNPVFMGDGINPESFTQVLGSGERCDSINSTNTGFVLSSHDKYDLHTAWSSATQAKLPVITNDYVYTYIKALKGT